MNSWVKLVLIIIATFLVIRTMRQGWGGAGGDLPQSVAGLVSQAKTLDRKVVLLITGPGWCPACVAMEQGMLSKPEWTAFAGKEIVFQAYNYPNGGEATSPAHEDLLNLPGVKGFPTLVVAGPSGKILALRSGYGGGADEYIQWIRSL